MFQKLVIYFQGRHTLYIFSALGLGAVMQLLGKLGPDFVHLLLGFGLLVFGHSVKDDFFKNGQ